jgi:acyl dehydratase
MTEHAVITEDMVDDVKRRLGVTVTPTTPFFNTEASRDTIRHFADAVGDPNPLYRDEEYAKNTAYGTIIAPPCFLYSVCWATGRVGFPGIHAWNSGSDWEWFRPIRLGDRFTYTMTLTDLKEKRSEMAGRVFIEYMRIDYRNQHAELVATCTGWSVRAERRASGERGKYKAIEKAQYTPEQLEDIWAAYDREEVRGAMPRYWEDVQVGDELTPVVKGPLTLRDLVTWVMGAGSPYMRAHRFALEYERRHPSLAMIDSRTGQVDVPELVHMEETRAQEIGIPGAYDYGCQRSSWLGHLLTNWMGDDGFLKKFYMELRRFNVVGDTTWCKGKVTRKYLDNGEPLVDVEVWAENQLGEITAPGRAVVRLPSKPAA